LSSPPPQNLSLPPSRTWRNRRWPPSPPPPPRGKPLPPLLRPGPLSLACGSASASAPPRRWRPWRATRSRPHPGAAPSPAARRPPPRPQCARPPRARPRRGPLLGAALPAAWHSPARRGSPSPPPSGSAPAWPWRAVAACPCPSSVAPPCPRRAPARRGLPCPAPVQPRSGVAPSLLARPRRSLGAMRSLARRGSPASAPVPAWPRLGAARPCFPGHGAVPRPSVPCPCPARPRHARPCAALSSAQRAYGARPRAFGPGVAPLPAHDTQRDACAARPRRARGLFAARPCARACSRGARGALAQLAAPSARSSTPPVYSMCSDHVIYINEMETQLRN
jgi:hypothetical protein